MSELELKAKVGTAFFGVYLYGDTEKKDILDSLIDDADQLADTLEMVALNGSEKELHNSTLLLTRMQKLIFEVMRTLNN